MAGSLLRSPNPPGRIVTVVAVLLQDRASRNGVTMRNGDSVVWELHFDIDP
jgi:hypothetical protein